MKLTTSNVFNQGMSQDYSISKDTKQEYAFENKNIRIQALDDGTLLSITNVRGPKEIPSINIQGIVVGKCFTKNYVVLFTVDGKSISRIYRLDIYNGVENIKCNCLYEGEDLHFHTDRVFDTLFFYENKNTQKVYWTESWKENDNTNNPPRVINIITPSERSGGECIKYDKNVFDFYPTINKIPRFKIQKDYSLFSEHPSGVIQYFISYYFENGAETLIAHNSSSFTIDYETRGAK
jgi:hypothetical protein